MAYRIAHISDPHLSLRRPFFQHNWEIMVELLNGDRPDLVVCTGDISIDGADHESELVYASAQLKRLTSDVLIVPGNHDCGNSSPDTRGGETLITAERLASFRRHVGPDFWMRDLGAWRLVGFNAMLPGSGLPDDDAQWEKLKDSLATADRRRSSCSCTSRCFWTPPESESRPSPRCIPNTAGALVACFRITAFSCSRPVTSTTIAARRWASSSCLWAPSTAFVIDAFGLVRSRYGVRRVGYVEYRLDGRRLSAEFVEPHALINYDLGNWMRNPEGFHARYRRGAAARNASTRLASARARRRTAPAPRRQCRARTGWVRRRRPHSCSPSSEPHCRGAA